MPETSLTPSHEIAARKGTEHAIKATSGEDAAARKARSQLPAVTIAGCGAITAVGRGIETLRAALHSNTSGLRPLERFNHPRFQSKVAGAAPTNLENGEDDDPALRLATDALVEAKQQARTMLGQIAPDRIGLVLSTTKANIDALERALEGRSSSASARRHLRGDLLAEDLAAAHSARGPVQCVSLACVSGLVAVQQGTKLIQRGAADAVLVVGVDHLSAFVVAGFSALKALDPAGCRPFDRDRFGLSPGEAGAALVLAQAGAMSGSESSQSGTRGRSDSTALIQVRGWGSSNDANHMTGPARDGSGLAQAIRVALASAGIHPRDVDYINAHGTGTPYNDAMESQALNAVFGNACPPVSGSKGMLGHTLGAAGLLETIVCVLAMQDRLLPGTPRLTAAAEGTPPSLVFKPQRARRLDCALKLNTGFGGVNGALLLSRSSAA